MKRMNKALRETIISLAGCTGYCDVLTKTPPPELAPKKCQQRLKQARNHFDKLMEECMAGLDEETTQSIIRYSKGCQLLIVPDADPRLNETRLLVTVEDVEELLHYTVGTCMTCMEDERGVKQCRLRKCLTRMGVIPKGTPRGVCPYQP